MSPPDSNTDAWRALLANDLVREGGGRGATAAAPAGLIKVLAVKELEMASSDLRRTAAAAVGVWGAGKRVPVPVGACSSVISNGFGRTVGTVRFEEDVAAACVRAASMRSAKEAPLRDELREAAGGLRPSGSVVPPSVPQGCVPGTPSSTPGLLMSGASAAAVGVHVPDRDAWLGGPEHVAEDGVQLRIEERRMEAALELL